MICVDDLRPELKSFGANYIIAPNIDQLAKEGISFQKHFVNAPSCGPSRYTLLTGQYGTVENDALFLRAKKIRENIVARSNVLGIEAAKEALNDEEFYAFSLKKNKESKKAGTIERVFCEPPEVCV